MSGLAFVTDDTAEMLKKMQHIFAYIGLPWGATGPKRGENASETHMYHHAKFHFMPIGTTVAEISVRRHSGQRQSKLNDLPY